ncbi:MAG: phage minor capsid protein [Sporolactobacillus sp.]
MLTPFQLNNLSQPIVKIYSKMEQDILYKIIDRLKTDQDISKDKVLEWQFEKFRQMGDLNKDVLKIISDASDRSLESLNGIMKKISDNDVAAVDASLAEAVSKGKVKAAPAPEKDSRVYNTLRTLQGQAKDKLNLVRSSLLQNTGQVYRDIISTSVAKVNAGQATTREAVAETASRWAEKGLPALIDSRGRHWSIEGYIPTVINSVNNDLTNQMTFARMDSYDCDLIQISSHMGARPLCYPYQSHIYSRNGKSKKYPSLASTSYGQPAGIFGVNCKHLAAAYVDGVNTRSYQQYPKAENDKVYQQTQKQRYYERKIRKAKTQLEISKRMDVDSAIQKAQAKVRNRQANMRQFINDSGMTRQYSREQTLTK